MDQQFVALRTQEDLQQALERPLALLYKHSPMCGLSDIAQEEVQRLAEAEPALPVYRVDVIRDRALARAIAERLGIRHESPQAILLRGGKAVWDASHRGVTADAIRDELAA